jgi:hypothetical protein
MLKALWTNVVRFIQSMEGMDDPFGDYVFSIGKRIDKLEADVDRLQRQMTGHKGTRAEP